MRNRNKRVLTTYPLKDVMAYAVMADTINNGEYIKQTVHKMEEFVESGTDPKYVVQSYSNKEIINVARPLSDEGTIVLAGRGGYDFV